MNYFIGNVIGKTNLIGINTPADPNDDMGVIMQIHPNNLTDWQFENTLTAATAFTATVQEIVARGWVIEITTGAAAGDRRRIISTSTFTVTVDVPFSAIPAAADTYRLYKKTSFAIVYKPQTAQYLVGYTHNDSLDKNVEIDPLPPQAGRTDLTMASDFTINLVSFVKIHTLTWNTAIFSATAGNLLINVEVIGSITVRLWDGTNLGSATYNSTGNYVLAVSLPAVNSTIELQVLGLGTLRSAILVF